MLKLFRELEHKFVDEVMEKNNEQAEKRKERDAMNKQRLNL